MEETGDSPNKPAFVQDEKLWLDDGNIIIRAGSGAGGAEMPIHGFKCHKSVLKVNSSVFADLFDIPTSGNAKIDGVECVDLPERWQDVQDLLWFFYGFSKPNSGPCAAENLAGCFKLSKKYDVPAITEKLQTVFDNAWPDSLAEWIALEKSRVKELHDLHIQIDWDIIDVNDIWPDPSPVVRLARETRTRTFLRAALYGLCRANITTPFSGYPDMFSEAYGAHESILRTSPDDLDLIDIGLLTVGRERIQNRTSHLLTTHIPQVITEHCSVEDMDVRGPRCDLSDTPTGQIVCSGPLQRWVYERMAQGSRELMFDPIWELTRMQEEITGSGPSPTNEVVCPACRRWFGKHLERQTQLFWDWLPEAFDFDKLGFE